MRYPFAGVLGVEADEGNRGGSGGVSGGGSGDEEDREAVLRRTSSGGRMLRGERFGTGIGPRNLTGNPATVAEAARQARTGGEPSVRRVGSARGTGDREWAMLHHAHAVNCDGSPQPLTGPHADTAATAAGRLASSQGNGNFSSPTSGGDLGRGFPTEGERGIGRAEEKEEEEADPEARAAAEVVAKAAATARTSLRWRAACGQVILARWRHRNLVRHAGTATPDERMFFKHFSRRLSRATATLDLAATAFGLRYAALLAPFLQVHIGVVRNLSLAHNPLAPRTTAGRALPETSTQVPVGMSECRSHAPGVFPVLSAIPQLNILMCDTSDGANAPRVYPALPT